MHNSLRAVARLALGVAALALPNANDARAQADTTMHHACYSPATGQVYRIMVGSTPSSCTDASHVELSWSAKGPTGPMGPKGVRGDSGAAGAAGANGPEGSPGVAGAAGPSGLSGVAGPTGPAGAKGETGSTGAAGPRGIDGIAGLIGPIGPQGERGDRGPHGPQGAQGSVGPNGTIVGATGPKGFRGAQGPMASYTSIPRRTEFAPQMRLGGNQNGTVTARCNSNEIAVGGGFGNNLGGRISITESTPIQGSADTPSGWRVAGYNWTLLDLGKLDVFVICVRIS